MGDDFLPADADVEWKAVKGAVVEMVPDRIVIWTSKSGADYVFLRMAVRCLHVLNRSIYSDIFRQRLVRIRQRGTGSRREGEGQR